MSNFEVLHATLISINNKGVLLCGKSGTGKSDLALRLIERYGALLVADDAVRICVQRDALVGSAPKNIAGLLEVRGVGIVKYPYLPQTEIDLVINLHADAEKIERMPNDKEDVILGLAIKQIDLYAKEDSAPEKILAIIRQML